MSVTEEEENNKCKRKRPRHLFIGTPQIITLCMCLGLVIQFLWQTHTFFNLLLSLLLVSIQLCMCVRETERDILRQDVWLWPWLRTFLIYVCVCNFARRKAQIIAHEMLFIQSSSSVTIPRLQHSTAYWRNNTTEQIWVKTVKFHKGSPLLSFSFTYFLLPL